MTKEKPKSRLRGLTMAHEHVHRNAMYMKAVTKSRMSGMSKIKS